MNSGYPMNKGVNRPVEFRGLKAQYIYYLASGLALLLVIFAIAYIIGVPLYVCLPVVLGAGGYLFVAVYRYSRRYGEHGLMKFLAHRKLPEALRCNSRSCFLLLNVNQIIHPAS